MRQGAYAFTPPSSAFMADENCSGSLNYDLIQSIEFVRVTKGMLYF